MQHHVGKAFGPATAPWQVRYEFLVEDDVNASLNVENKYDDIERRFGNFRPYLVNIFAREKQRAQSARGMA